MFVVLIETSFDIRRYPVGRVVAEFPTFQEADYWRGYAHRGGSFRACTLAIRWRPSPRRIIAAAA